MPNKRKIAELEQKIADLERQVALSKELEPRVKALESRVKALEEQLMSISARTKYAEDSNPASILSEWLYGEQKTEGSK